MIQNDFVVLIKWHVGKRKETYKHDSNDVETNTGRRTVRIKVTVTRCEYELLAGCICKLQPGEIRELK